MTSVLDLNSLELLDNEDLLKIVKGVMSGGVVLSFHGKRTATEIAKRVRPRVTRRIADMGVGTPEEQSRNMIVEGENLQAMVTLYKYRGQIDLIVTDPPYNTGQQFRYNDRWDEDPNDPDLGTLVTMEDGSRHTKWMKAILPRLQMMKAMLKPQGVIAVCIDDNELFQLGMIMNEVFGEENRLAIINWQKAHAPKNNTGHVSTATEYVLVYAKDKGLSKTHLLPRDSAMNKSFRNLDDDPVGDWMPKDPTGREHRRYTAYAVQSPFTGMLHYPGGEYKYDGHVPEARAHWLDISKDEMREALEEWGTPYELRDLGDKRGAALVLAGSGVKLTKYNPEKDPVFCKAREAANKRRDKGEWPVLYFRDDQQRRSSFGRPRLKSYVTEIKQGKVPTTYWADDEYDEPIEIGSQSWDHEETGHSDGARRELDAILGAGHGFQTVKPLRLMRKIIQLWSPPSGVVMDPYAGSGTVGHALLELNKETGAERRFILVEQGRPENGDKYARTLTRERIRRAITGERPEANGKLKVTADSLGGGFEFRMLTTQIDAKVVLSMRKDELIDVVITSHWDSNSRNSPTLIRVDDKAFKFLVGKNHKNEGYFLIWNGGNAVGSLDVDNYNIVLQEGRKAGLKAPYHVYARYELYQSQNVVFYKIPDKILAHLGLNESSDRYNEED